MCGFRRARTVSYRHRGVPIGRSDAQEYRRHRVRQAAARGEEEGHRLHARPALSRKHSIVCPRQADRHHEPHRSRLAQTVDRRAALALDDWPPRRRHRGARTPGGGRSAPGARSRTRPHRPRDPRHARARLTAIAVQVESALQHFERDPDKARRRLERALAVSRESLDEARRSVLGLRASPLQGKDLSTTRTRRRCRVAINGMNLVTYISVVIKRAGARNSRPPSSVP